MFIELPRLALVAPEFPWEPLARRGQRLIAEARFGAAGLPVEWTALGGPPAGGQAGPPRPAEGFPAQFGYNALRIPLYLAMAGIRERALYAPFLALWDRPAAGLALVDTGSGRTTERLAETGYAAIPALAACAASATPFPASLRAMRADGQHYYPATLHLLALAGLATRFPECAPR